MTKKIIVNIMILILNPFSVDLVSGSRIARAESIKNNQTANTTNKISGLTKRTMTAKAYKTLDKKNMIYTESHHAYSRPEK